MEDVARQTDSRGIAVQRVGVKDLHLPLLTRCRDGGHQAVLGSVDLAVELPEEQRGTHMSRLVDLLYRWHNRSLDSEGIRQILTDAMQRLKAPSSQISVRFKYFMAKRAPVSGAESVLDYDCGFEACAARDRFSFVVAAAVPVTTVCPCSREIADRGAHNQRAVVSCRLAYHEGEFVWLEELVETLEGLGSCDLYPVLKRDDEKVVTERGYDNPKFVEDVLRDGVLALRADPRVRRFSLEVEALESIHNHSAYAYHEEDLCSQNPLPAIPQRLA